LPFTLPPTGLPVDPAPWAALLLSPLVFLAARPLLRGPASPRRGPFLALAALAALALSAAYVVAYLRGGPRIIDATSYFLEARTLAQGKLAWPLDAPASATLGRFLVRSDPASGPAVAVIFPPGYPALLALGFLVRAPMIIGPLLAAALVVATYALGDAVAQSPALAAPARALSIPRLAAALSVTCAALRYHTADTMSHGLAALCFTVALVLTFHALDDAAPLSPRRAILAAIGAGLAAGWLLATRPVSALALAAVLAVGFLTLGRGLPRARRLRLAAALVAGALPGLLLLLAHQRAATGALGLSSQRLYYALADGPPGCFRYGFGAGIGCLGEHGDFVRHNLPDGYGPLQAAATTLRRLKLHLVDPANLELWGLLVPVGAALGFRAPRVRLLAAAIALQIAAYAPFYFDGNYPGGGARFFADLLPLEHVLLALGMAEIAARRPVGRLGPERWGAALLALSLVGFAFRAGFDHALLRDREGGRPLFEPARLAEAGVSAGLLFLDTDHGFNLALDPGAAARGGVQALRFHGDDLDRQAWEQRGEPPPFRYRVDLDRDPGPARVHIEPLLFPAAPPSTRVVEAESLWPPRDQEGGWIFPEYASGTCASASRWLALHAASSTAPALAQLEIPVEGARGRWLAPRVALGPGAAGSLTLRIDGILAHRWPLNTAPESALQCLDLPALLVPPGARRLALVLERSAGVAPPVPFALDRLDFRIANPVDP
jgi:hypothetical protein